MLYPLAIKKDKNNMSIHVVIPDINIHFDIVNSLDLVIENAKLVLEDHLEFINHNEELPPASSLDNYTEKKKYMWVLINVNSEGGGKS
jgi:hypothetical protein